MQKSVRQQSIFRMCSNQSFLLRKQTAQTAHTAYTAHTAHTSYNPFRPVLFARYHRVRQEVRTTHLWNLDGNETNKKKHGIY